MKLQWILLCLMVSSFAESNLPSSDCNVWPADMLPMRMCCDVSSFNRYQTNINCSNDCIYNCYANRTGIISNGVFNKTAVLLIYRINLFCMKTHNDIYCEEMDKTDEVETETRLEISEHDLSDSSETSLKRKYEMMTKIENAVDKCNYSSANTLSVNLIKFYECVEDVLAKNCRDYENGQSCDSSIELHEKCNNIKPNCSEWSSSLQSAYQYCCRVPKLFSYLTFNRFKKECQAQPFFTHKKFECAYNKILQEKRLLIENGKIDMEIVKEMLMNSTSQPKAWEKLIDAAVKRCGKLAEGKHFQLHRMKLISLKF